ncbi:ABC transporter permease [Tissierella sp. Yu-01]|uniref:ABC transporter permease n=1 Tax=Tissierella sp. Yu-01 TaxID=3035694 RepID=UPI00240D35EA|nr:ABC transporter permease [Tissierella sp. Yu-01]WFA08169.1 ABC transporter permease [Tissierella sp. Yu-01]
MLKENIKMSWQNITGNRMRSFLTILGIVIGVAAIIALITIVQGVTDEINNQFMNIGTGKVTVQAYGTPLKQGLSDNDIKNLSDIENVKGVSPNLSFPSSAVKNYEVIEDVRIEGKNEVYFKDNKDILSRGRVFNILDMNSKNKVAIIDQKIAEGLFFGKDPLGDNLIIAGTTYEIVGVLKDSDSQDVMAMMNAGNNKNGRIMIPYTTAMKIAGVGNISSVDITIDDTSIIDDTVASIELVLDQAFNYKDDSYYVINLDTLIETMKTMQGMMTTMLAGIAGISLLVGGIGIMNMMLVSVTERTTEIGLRKALGAEPGSIQVQFLIESIFLSLLGGFIGLLLGVGISYLACNAINIPFSISTSAITLAVGFSAGIGIIFGWTPARKASLLNPIDALRSI